jgi:futalosine hydrolase
MNVLVVAATNFEILPFVNNNTNTDVLITGVGVPACMYKLLKQLQHKKYDFIIQAGIAGTFKSGFALGNTYAVGTDLFADVGLVEANTLTTLFEAGFANANEKPFENGILKNKSVEKFNLPIANAITVNTVSDNIITADLYRKKFNADIESMEGAALHYVCLSEDIPFLQIRSISNFVGERLKANWKMKEAIESLNKSLDEIVKKLNNE